MSKLLVCLNVLWASPLILLPRQANSVDIWKHSSRPSEAWQDDSPSLLDTPASLTNLLHICKAVLIILIGV